MTAVLGTVNRTLLALVGSVLLGAGTVLLAGLPPYTGRGDVLLSAADRHRWSDHGWWWPVVLAALALLVLLALWWLLAQVRRSRLSVVLVDTGDGAGALLRGRALEAALTEEAAALDGVAQARVTLHGRREAPEVRLRLVLEPHAVPADAVAALEGGVLARARASVGLTELPAEARLRVVAHHAQRVN
ncbi:alkaline shock response membrane anchor protein AmaP [Streptomyces sp. NPDC097619]|uniref:alkaline shock response membrane anchor protein AmaP n=1 Tax=Streptomyces sp. NPDC097619 TaxID=3157228 RepID=UPI00332A9DAF